jgi:hypothetical protein
MIFNSTSCMLLYDQRPTQTTSQFKQWLRSNFYLKMMAVLDSCVSKPLMPKQMKINAVEVDWNGCLSSTMLQIEESTKCHRWSMSWQFQFFTLLALILWNSRTQALVGDGSNKKQHNWWWIQWEMMKKVWKKMEKMERYLEGKFVRSQIVKCHYAFLL